MKMGDISKECLIDYFKKQIASIGWRLFIWGNSYTEEEYWEQIYEQEKAFREPLEE